MAATPEEDRRISVTIEQAENRRVSVMVHDSGPGLGPEILKNLFKPFCTTKETGLGMGLAICRSMLETRGGTLTAGNHAEGGALFQMTVPIEAVHE
jgi:C4-dicarboxylate-specific signal transduction histidine kinase